jgi:3-isopropylmalate/(R)-2-methylmalate dehydratase small subunit
VKAIHGKAWVFGDSVDTDALAPGAYLKAPIAEMAKHCLEAIDEGFASNVEAGDIVVAGENFGLGSSREQAAAALIELGVGAVIAKSFARIFYRNAMNLGLPVLVCAEAGKIEAGQALEVDPGAGMITITGSMEHFACAPIPAHLLSMIADGGLLAHLEKKLKGPPA